MRIRLTFRAAGAVTMTSPAKTAAPAPGQRRSCQLLHSSARLLTCCGSMKPR